MAPDLLLHGARVLAGTDLPRAESLAIKGDRIMAIGRYNDLAELASKQTREIDLSGTTIVPGFVDSHAHLDREGLRRAFPSLSHCRSIADVQATIAEIAATRDTGSWVVTSPLGSPPFHLDQETSLEERRYPDRLDLDAAAPEHPVWMRPVWGHWTNRLPLVHVLNTPALRACGIEESTESGVPSVEIERDEAGRPTGRILEWNVWPAAEFTVLRAAPRLDAELRRSALLESMHLSLQAGTTSIFEGHGLATEVHEVYQRLHDDGSQHVRVVFPMSLPPYQRVSEAEAMLRDLARWASGPGAGDEWLKVSGVYLEYGGSEETTVAAHAAWPYVGWAGFCPQFNPPDEYRELCLAAAKLRLRVTTFIKTCIDEVLSIWTAVNEVVPIRDLRWVLVHGHEIDPHRDFPRIRNLGAVITTQPASYLYRSGLEAVAGGIAPERLLAHKDYITAGLPWALSTDNKPYSMLFALWVAVARVEMHEGKVTGPSQRVSIVEALHAMTSAGAHVSFEEQHRGTLETGKLADLVVLPGDLLASEPDTLRTLRPLLTMVGGRVAYAHPSVG